MILVNFRKISIQALKDMKLIIDTLNTRVGEKCLQTTSKDPASLSHSDGRNSNRITCKVRDATTNLKFATIEGD